MCYGCHVRRLTGIAREAITPTRRDLPPEQIPPGCCTVHADSPLAEKIVGLDSYPVHRALVTGRVVAVLWPPWRFGWLRRQVKTTRLRLNTHG
jgi:hypothetical protein